MVYYAIEMRVGKNLIAFQTTKLFGAKRVLFITKKKAIDDIKIDWVSAQFDSEFHIDIINYEQIHKVADSYDIIIIDEAHSLGAFPKPSLRTKRLKGVVKDTPVIYLSGTPTPESWSQIFHQLWISDHSPFNMYKTFYKWAGTYVDKRTKFISGFMINDYSHADQDRIEEKTKHLFVRYSQKDAGFKGKIKERVEMVTVDPNISRLIKILLKDRVYTFKDGVTVMCDTASSLKSKIHQLCSGTLIRDKSNTDRVVLDYSKAEYIKKHYSDRKIVVFYWYQAEADALRKVLDNIVDTHTEFNETKNPCVFISQVVSGAMGINLSTADVLLYYNIMFSSTIYQQSRARTQTKDKDIDSQVVWLFSNMEESIEPKIEKVLHNKQTYSMYYFKKDYEVSV